MVGFKKKGMEEWLENVIKSMYKGVKTAVKLKDDESVESEVTVGHRAQCSLGTRRINVEQ